MSSAPQSESPRRESPLSVAGKWLPWCLTLIFALTIVWTALVAWDELSTGNRQGVVGTLVATVSNAAPAVPLIVLYAILTVSAFDFVGGLAMVTAKYLTEKFLEPWREKRREEAKKAMEKNRAKILAEGLAQGLAEGRAQGRTQGHAEGRAQGEAEERRRWVEWNPQAAGSARRRGSLR